MFVTNGNTKNLGRPAGVADPNDDRLVPLPWVVRLLQSLRRIKPSHLPVASKLALSISVMLTVIMALLGAVIVHDQTKHFRNQITLQGTTMVQTLSKAMGEQITLAQIPATKPGSAPVAIDKADPLLTLKVMTTQINTSQGILGAAVYSADGKILTREGNFPFQRDAPYANQEKRFLDNQLHILEWRWESTKTGELNAVTFISPIELQNTVVGHLLITFNYEKLQRTIRIIAQSIIIATLLMILLGVIFSYILGRHLTRPLYNLIDASRAIGQGNYNYRLPETRNDEIGYLMRSFNQMAQGLHHKAQVEQAFSRHVAPNIAKEIIENVDDLHIGGKHFHASVMFVDIVGFTSISESLEPEKVARLLNEFYTAISKISDLYHGVIDKFMGDCAMVVFGIPQEDEEHVFNSIACAVCFQKFMREQNRVREAQGLFPIHYRIGVNTGDMLAGNMGSNERVQYTVVGESVNLASRLCSTAPSDRIIITDETYSLAGLRRKIIATRHERLRIRGISNPVNTHLVQDLQEPYLREANCNIHQLLEEVASSNSDDKAMTE